MTNYNFSKPPEKPSQIVSTRKAERKAVLDRVKRQRAQALKHSEVDVILFKKSPRPQKI